MRHGLRRQEQVDRLRCRAAVGMLLIIVLCAACDSDSARPAPSSVTTTPAAWFKDVASAAGLEFTHLTGHDQLYLAPEILSGGAALFDMDNDGDLDAYMVQGGGLLVPPENRARNQLFRNVGSGVFENASAGSGADVPGYGMGVAAGDYDNDGDVDLYITRIGPNVLLRNDGSGRFEDVTESAGVGDTGFGASAAFADLDADGDLDLFVVNYVRWSIETERECTSAAGKPDYCGPNTYEAPAQSVL